MYYMIAMQMKTDVRHVWQFVYDCVKVCDNTLRHSYTQGISMMEHAGIPLQNFFLRRLQARTVFQSFFFLALV
jgi:hypothetical protein